MENRIIKTLNYFTLKRVSGALVGMAQWIECWPMNQKVDGLIPSQGTCLSFRPGPQLGVGEKQPIDVSLTH